MRGAERPAGLVLDEVPAPRRLASYSAALTAETIETVSDAPVASGRFVVLHEPDGHEAWGGDFRLVVMVRSRLDEEIASDPLLGSAAWSWLAEALDGAGAGHRNLVGTVTRVLSETFGGLELSDSCAHAEVRASWTPLGADLRPHMEAWYELIRMAAGHEPDLATPIALASVLR